MQNLPTNGFLGGVHSARALLLSGCVALACSPAMASEGQQWLKEAFRNSDSATAASFSSSGSAFSSVFDLSSGTQAQGTLARGTPLLEKEGIARLQKAIERYRAIVKEGGWKSIPDEALGLQAGVTHPAVALLRRRLEATGDLRTSGGFENTFDYYVAEALQRFQTRHGLEATGTLVNKSRRSRNGSLTLAALNVPAQSRLLQLQLNQGRLRRHLSEAGKRYIIVNIPAAQVEAVESGEVALRMVAVVGKRERRTPLLSSQVHEINFNPTWTLPPTVVREDLIPRGRDMQRRSQSVLEKFGIDAYDDYGGRRIDPSKVNWNSSSVHNYVYQQAPGPDNPLGFVKINFGNAHSVYMHDTPSKRLFGQVDRAASSGCIRVLGIEHLVTWILSGNDGWDSGRVAAMKRNGETKSLAVRKQPKLHFIYVTSWVAPDGTVNFRRDLYGYDVNNGVSRLAAAE